ncbi:MAG: hypothetical protein PVG66_09995 [Chromatiales bacterium]|jgi:hypothetical protein
MTSILLHAREAGIATLFAELIPVFQQQQWRVCLDFNDAAMRCLPSMVFDRDQYCDVLLCGYDAASQNETGSAIRRAAGLSMLTIGLLDAWKGLQRFWHDDGQLREMPDYLLVPDNYIADWLKSNGLANTGIEVVEHPKIARFRSMTQFQREQRKQAAMMKLPAVSGKSIIFYSEPVHENICTGSAYQSLADIKIRHNESFSVLKWIEKMYSRDYQLLFRPHPAENRQVPDGWLDASCLSLEESLFMPDKIIGVGSTMLMYAVAAGLDVVNISDLIRWQPQQSDYDNEVWLQLVKSGSFGHGQGNASQASTISVVEKIQALMKMGR